MEIKDKEPKIRHKGWFKVGYVFFDAHAKNIGPKAALTYLCIKGYEHKKTRRAWPSEDTLAEKLDLSRRTVSRAIKILNDHNLIHISKEKAGSPWSHNVYHLTHSSEWRSTPIRKEDSGETNSTFPQDKKDEISMTQSPLKKNNRKRTKEILSEEQGEDSLRNVELADDINQLKEKMNLKF